MKSILLQLNDMDYFNLITFSSTAHTWKPSFLEVTQANINVRYDTLTDFSPMVVRISRGH